MLTSTVQGVKWNVESRVATMPHSQCLSKAISYCSPTANHCKEFWEASRLQKQCYPYGLWLAFELKRPWKGPLAAMMTAIRQGGCAHGRHALLHVCTALPLDELDGLEGFVHIADGQVKAEVEHGVAGGLLAVLQAHKVSESSPGHHVGELGNRPPRRLGRHRWCGNLW